MPKTSSKNTDRTRYPLPTPIDDGSRICVKLYIPNILEHRAAFQGAVLNLAHWYSWQLDDLHQGKAAAAVWEQIYLDMMETFYDGCPDDKPCHTFTPAAAFIEWFPNNPYTQPDLVTDGYNQPAWYQATAISNAVLGTQYGDIATDLTRFPPGSLPTIIPASGLPRFRVNLVGEGRVTLALLNIFGGSIAQITIDDDITTLRLIDSDRDLIAVPPETATETIVEVEITGAGAHHIDVIIVSQINDSIPFLHHGGGLRKVELCGFESMVTLPNPIFRFTEDCKLQVSYNGSDYEDIPGWTDFAPVCFAGAPGAPGADGAPGDTGNPGAPGAPGAPGTNASIRCAVANGLVRGMIDEYLVPMIDAIIDGINTSTSPEGIEALALERWLELTPGTECAGTFSTQVNILVEMNVPDGALEIYRSALADEPLKLDMIRGIYCWLCENGSLDPARLGDFTNAVLSLFPGDVPREIFANWFFVALGCSINAFSAMIARRQIVAGCVDCAEMDCTDWETAFTEWHRDFAFNETNEFWFGRASGTEKTDWESGHGFKPFGSPAGSGNFSCISIASTTPTMLLKRIEIGLETPYPIDGHLLVTVEHHDTSLTEDYNTDFPPGADFFVVEYLGTVEMDQIQIHINPRDSGCTTSVEPTPYIRYVTVYGNNPNPF